MTEAEVPGPLKVSLIYKHLNGINSVGIIFSALQSAYWRKPGPSHQLALSLKTVLLRNSQRAKQMHCQWLDNSRMVLINTDYGFCLGASNSGEM